MRNKETPAAKRKRLQGKRGGEERQTEQFSLDMEEDLLVETWESFNSDDWTRPIRLKTEMEERKNTPQEKEVEDKEKKKRIGLAFFKKF